MEDKELIELAARAAGITGTWHRSGFVAYSGWSGSAFDPLNDDGDALRLAVKVGRSINLTLMVGCGGADCQFDRPLKFAFEDGDDPFIATRRAITRAAAQIGKEME